MESSEYHPAPLELAPRAAIPVEVLTAKKRLPKTVEKFLFHPHTYNPDFIIRLTERGARISHGMLGIGMPDRSFMVDVKGGFSRHNADEPFAINRKWVYSRYGIYVDKVIPDQLFKATWVPEEARLTRVRREVVKSRAGMLTLEQFMKTL